MYNQNNIWSEHRIALERYHNIVAEREQERIIRLIRQQQPRRAWYGRLPARLGHWLVHWGRHSRHAIAMNHQDAPARWNTPAEMEKWRLHDDYLAGSARLVRIDRSGCLVSGYRMAQVSNRMTLYACFYRNSA